ncbi:hypothetical protein [Bradyrhizobium liaoningense]|nr:hypothetical protein [Bradyrhizobium liaoningense]
MDEKLQHYRELAERANDKLTNEALDGLAKQYEAQKLAMHSKPEK